MIALSAEEIAAAISARGHHSAQGSAAGSAHAVRAVIDAREAGPGDLFFGLPGARVDGGSFARDAIENGAWGVVVGDSHFDDAVDAATRAGRPVHVFASDDPLAALGGLANCWRHRLAATVIGVTGSTGKTSTKDILAALIGRTRAVVATPANLNTEIGMPLTMLSAPLGTEVLVLEMAMRGKGQIDQLANIAEPDVGCIVNVGPVHLEQLGSVEGVAAAKAELIARLGPDGHAVVPAGEALLLPHLRDDLTTVTFGSGGDVRLEGEDADGALRIATPEGEVRIRPSFREHFLKQNLLAAIACAQAIGVPVDAEVTVAFSALRGEIREVLGGVTLINDCYNANPVSMRAALDNLGLARGRRVAVLGGMGELGPNSAEFHREVAEHAEAAGVELLIAVGKLATQYRGGFGGEFMHVDAADSVAGLVRDVARPGDTVLVKGSRSVGLEAVGEGLVEPGKSSAGVIADG
jgi:UDP-N-acetylmuramoyl-tripeptide--D-alanyl-D-alanine ligase